MQNRRFSGRLFIFAFLAVFLAGSAQAQYFGRNKVEWEKFHFKILHTPHFDIYYYDEEKNVIDDVGRMAERWYDRLSRVFNHSFRRKPIVLYANSADFQQTTTTSGLIGEGTGGFTDAFINRIVLPLTGDYAENDHVLGHEMVHVFQYDIANLNASTQRRFNLEMLPLWMVEGMAEYFSKGRVDPLTAMWIRDSTQHDRMPDLRKLDRDPRYFPYRYGEALMAYIGGRYGDDAVIRYFLIAGSVGPEEAVHRALGVTSKQLFDDWKASARELYEPVFTTRPSALGQPILGGRKKVRDLNVGPAISPDGRLVAFLSSRDLFSIDLYVADAITGANIRRVASSDFNRHYEALRFIDSAGSWSPDSKRLAFVVFERGDNQLALMDVDSGHVSTLKLPGIEALSNPAWSPDGRTIAFTGQKGGVSDLFLYDIASGQVTQLTNDKYADLEPAWSPDGRTLAFATDRGDGTSLEQLSFRPLTLATIDIESRNIRIIPLFTAGRAINPQYGPDGSLYFIANPDGISDIYRYSFANGTITRITTVSTGVSGITDSSPALSVALRNGEIEFSLFEDDDYNVYHMAANPQGTIASAAVSSATPRAAMLPPLNPTASTALTAYLHEPTVGLPPPNTTFNTTPYSSSMHLTYVGPPTVGVSGDRFGYGIGGAVSAYFSDMLGTQQFGFTLQGGSGTSQSFGETIGGELLYLNQAHRINWGGIADHIPYITGSTVVFQDLVDIGGGQKALADIVEQRRDILTLDELSGISQYPLSQTRRFELNAGFQRYGFTSEVERAIYIGGQLVDDTLSHLPAPSDLAFFRGAAAYVGDSAQFGFISPVKGTRYRFQGEAFAGDLHFETALADWRKYMLMRPITFAVRAFHYGRYGSDAESDRLSPLYVGQEGFVRGYQFGSFNTSECVGGSNPNACPVFDRLFGSRMAYASAEVRVPLFGTREYGLINAPFLPTELVGFVDGGAAWSQGDSLKVKFAENTSERVPVFSAGVATRVLLSYIPVELYWAKPFQRPDSGWVFGWYIAPGW